MKTKIIHFVAGSLTTILVFACVSVIANIRGEHRAKQTFLDMAHDETTRQMAEE